jgi:hypothetical protein
VRLRKGFVNVERAPFGGLKLRIPTLLYVEKMRTQSRFNVTPPLLRMRFALRAAAICIKTRLSGWQLMRMEASQQQPVEEGEARDKKTVHNASSKVSLVVQRMLFPLLDSPMRTHVILDTDGDQLELDLLDQVGRSKPGLMEDQQTFIQHLLGLLERYRHSGYSRVPTR